MREGENLTLTLSVADLFMETSIVVGIVAEPGEGACLSVCITTDCCSTGDGIVISPMAVIISAANTPYTITVSGQNDDEPEEDETVTITFTSSANVMPLERSITVIDTTSKAHTSKCAVVTLYHV